jgi:hypothetical protein
MTLRALVAVAATALLSACGGGGGNSGTAAPPAPQQALRADVLYGYFGVDGNQIAETASHVTLNWTADWGNWSDPADRERVAQRQIAQIQEAEARGVRKHVVSVGFALFDADFRPRGTEELSRFRSQIEALGLLGAVVALYIVDEPETHAKLSIAAFREAISGARAAWPEAKLAVIYGPGGAYPAIDAFDWVGHDNYDRGEAVLDDLPPIRADQRWILVPGGADPWRTSPARFVARANLDPRVAAIVPFAWFDGYAGTGKAGIRSNGMAPAYCAVLRGAPCAS